MHELAQHSPIFVVGCDRSGTTLLRLMLDAHRNLCIPNESDFIVELWQSRPRYGNCTSSAELDAFMRDLSAIRRYRLWGINDSEVRQHLNGHRGSFASLINGVFHAFAQREGKRRWGDKTPRYTVALPVIAALFPHACVIHLIRDGRDVAASLKEVSWHPHDIAHNAYKWKRYIETCEADRLRYFPGTSLAIHYESLVSAPERTLKYICALIEEQYDPGMLDFSLNAERKQPEGIRDHSKTLQPANTSSVGRWRTTLTEDDLRIFYEAAADTLAAHGYCRAAESDVRGPVRSAAHAAGRRIADAVNAASFLVQGIRTYRANRKDARST